MRPHQMSNKNANGDIIDAIITDVYKDTDDPGDEKYCVAFRVNGDEMFKVDMTEGEWDWTLNSPERAYEYASNTVNYKTFIDVTIRTNLVKEQNQFLKEKLEGSEFESLDTWKNVTQFLHGLTAVSSDIEEVSLETFISWYPHLQLIKSECYMNTEEYKYISGVKISETETSGNVTIKFGRWVSTSELNILKGYNINSDLSREEMIHLIEEANCQDLLGFVTDEDYFKMYESYEKMKIAEFCQICKFFNKEYVEGLKIARDKFIHNKLKLVIPDIKV